MVLNYCADKTLALGRKTFFPKMPDLLEPVVTILVEYVTPLNILVSSSLCSKERSKIAHLKLSDIAELCEFSDQSKLSFFWILDTTSSNTPVYVRVLNDEYVQVLCNLHIARGANHLTFRAQSDA